MKFFLVLSILYSGVTLGQSTIYDQTLQGLNGKEINTSIFKDKKILIAAVSPNNLKSAPLSFLNSLQKANPSVVVIIIPALDFGGDENTAILNTIKGDSTLRVIVTTGTQVTKVSNGAQHPLMNWLTHVKRNSHFDSEVLTDNQLFFISETGILYAVLEKGASVELINELLNQKPVMQ